MIEIYVSDTGVGIYENDIKKLFKIDEKIRSEGTEGEPSSGLGLLLCKEFVEKHGRNIWAESETGKVSTFYFTIPIQNSISLQLLINNIEVFLSNKETFIQIMSGHMHV